MSGVTGPLPELEEAYPSLPGTPRMVIHNSWTLYSHPAPRFGMPVMRTSEGETWEVTGRWHPDPEPPGYQWWVIAPYNTWYRLRSHIQPGGLVSVWSLLPDQWMTGAVLDDIPWVDAPWGQVWDVVPYSIGHYLVAKEDLPLALHTCPQVECPVFYQATTNVPVTGVFGRETETWYRVDYKETQLWVQGTETQGLSMSPRGRLRLLSNPAGLPSPGWRSCEPIVFFPPPPVALCPVDAQGRFTDEFERQYDKLDPVFGREDFRSGE